MGDDTRGFLATVRSLGRKGITVHAAPTDFRSPALASRYVAAVHDIPPWMDDGADWLAAMRALLSGHRYDLVIPCDERNLLPLQHHRAELEPLARLAIPDDQAIDVLFDKHATRELARQVGVAVAPGRLLQPGDDAESLLAEFGAPIVVKPRRSYTLEMLGTRGRVHVLSDAAKLRSVLDAAEPGEVLLEGCFEGEGLGVSILAHRGKLLQAFEHHRVHERSGSSFYRVSAKLNPELVQACAAIAEGVGYTGVAMFEFKQNRAGAWILLEVNARPWGSLPLPVALGVDFPYRWYRLLVEGVETPAVEYRAGVYGRNLMPDMLAAVADAQARELAPVRFGLFMAGRMAEMYRVLTLGEVQDVMVRDDPGPARQEFRRFCSEAVRRARKRLPGGAARSRAAAEATVRAAIEAGRPVRVLFVCQGNICRSAYAATALRIRMPDERLVQISSAGMMPRPGRQTPELGREAAARNGIDLRAHRSSWMSREAGEGASLIVVFDEVNATALADRYPDLATPAVKLGELIAIGDIYDPVDGDAAVFDMTFAAIGRGIQALARLLA
jgi:protein-tyrosine-phosphatase/predicted ATP-grasp superfamily ATP-dependent carboligase